MSIAVALSLPDANEPITVDWLRLWANEAEFVWDIRGTDYFLYHEKSGPRRGLWTLSREEEDGDEIEFGAYLTRGELRRVLDALLPHAEAGWNETDAECPDGN